MSITIRSAQTVSNGVTLRGNNTQYVAPVPLPILFELDASNYSSPLSTWEDISGNGRHATVHGSPSFYNDSIGGYFGFTGNAAQYIDMAGSGSGWGIADNKIPNATISVWANIIQYPLNYQHVFGWRSDSFHFYFLMITGGSSNITEARVVSQGGSYDINQPYDDYFNTWAYITFVADGNAGTSRLYINGTQIGTQGIGSSIWTPSGGLFTIASVGPDYPLHGYIGGAMAYSRALTPEEIASEFNRTKTRYGV